MSEILSYKQFEASVPNYITRAHSAAAKIIELGLSDHNSGVEVGATAWNLDMAGYSERVSGPNQLDHLWQTRNSVQSFQADVAVSANRRLAIDGMPNISEQPEGRSVRAWVYRTSEADQGTTEWIASDTRAYLGNLAMPGYIFPEKENFTGLLNSLGVELGPQLYSYVYTQSDARAGRFTFRGARGVGNIPIASLRDAVAPVLTDQDKELLHGGIYTFSAHKIEELLGIMERIAQTDA